MSIKPLVALATLSIVTLGCGGVESSADPDPTVVTTTTAAPATSTTRPPEPDTTTTTEPEAEYPERFSSGKLFEFVGSAPVITNGPDREWDWQYTDPGAVVVHDGVIHVFQNGFVGWPAPVGVGYWKSEDGGQTWIEVAEEPVFQGNDLDYVGRAALASSVIVMPDGTWALYFYTWDAAGWPAAPSVIGRAMAPGPLGPWIADPEPVLVPGAAGSWDEFFVRTPSVLATDDGFEMFYAGGSRDRQMIGRATSTDGVNWVKYDDPATEMDPFADSDPVLMPGDPREGNVWDQRNVFQPRVVKTDDGYVMSYAAAPNVTDPLNYRRKIGLAVSEDGFAWTRSLGVVVTTGEINGSAVYFASLAHDGDRYLLFVEVQKGNETEVFLATQDGPLP